MKHLIASVAGLCLAAACGPFSGDDRPAPGHRLIQGELEPPQASVLTSRDQVALQLAALEVDTSTAGGSPITGFTLGESFNPASNAGNPVRFRIAIPLERTVVLIFQTPQGRGGLGQLVARVVFAKNARGEETDVLPGAAQDLDLGVLKITSPQTSQQSGEALVPPERWARLGEGGSLNPLSQNDVDGDGTPDLEDADDDNDLIPDDGDEDANGDGVPDVAQSLESLEDLDGDRIPDVLER